MRLGIFSILSVFFLAPAFADEEGDFTASGSCSGSGSSSEEEDFDGDGWVTNDCDETNEYVSPGADEEINGIDDDCDGDIDCEDSELQGDEECSEVIDTDIIDTDDTDDGDTDLPDLNDLDNDGVLADEDCDDNDDEVGGPETAYPDLDGDGYTGDSEPMCPADMGDDWSDSPGLGEDCNDDPNNGGADVSTPTEYLEDSDEDGFPMEGSEFMYCGSPPGDAQIPSDEFEGSYDCDDADETINPDAYEMGADGIDNNCDGVEEECEEGSRQPHILYVSDGADVDSLSVELFNAEEGSVDYGRTLRTMRGVYTGDSVYDLMADGTGTWQANYVGDTVEAWTDECVRNDVQKYLSVDLDDGTFSCVGVDEPYQENGDFTITWGDEDVDTYATDSFENPLDEDVDGPGCEHGVDLESLDDDMIVAEGV